MDGLTKYSDEDLLKAVKMLTHAVHRYVDERQLDKADTKREERRLAEEEILRRMKS
jgi:hypothetical protein